MDRSIGIFDANISIQIIQTKNIAIKMKDRIGLFFAVFFNDAPRDWCQSFLIYCTFEDHRESG
jgi:hypothetical protein